MTITSALRGIAVATALSFSPAAFAAGAPTGVWIDNTGKGAIEITDCAGQLCGRLVWVADAADAEGCGL